MTLLDTLLTIFVVADLALLLIGVAFHLTVAKAAQPWVGS